MIRTSSVLLALTVTIGPSCVLAQSNPASSELADLTGSWTCSYHGPAGNQKINATASRLDTDWIALNGGTGPGSLITYDAKRKQWVQFRTGTEGNYALMTAQDPPYAATLHWKMVYPEQISVGTTTIQKSGPSTRIVKSTFMHGGKLLSSTAVCTRSR